MANCWFGRPLLLSSAVARGRLVKDKLAEAVDAELALGCDGFVLRLGVKSTDAPLPEQMALFDEAVRSYARRAFIYFELPPEARVGIGPLVDLLRRHAFPRGHMVASANPATLMGFFRLHPEPSSQAALMVRSEKELAGLRRCPKTAVEIADALATHERILGIHKSGRDVFVRATFAGATGEPEMGKIDKRVRWLIYEGVDAIISDRADLLAPLLGSERTGAT